MNKDLVVLLQVSQRSIFGTLTITRQFGILIMFQII